jgi:hypothetical protein
MAENNVLTAERRMNCSFHHHHHVYRASNQPNYPSPCCLKDKWQDSIISFVFRAPKPWTEPLLIVESLINSTKKDELLFPPHHHHAQSLQPKPFTLMHLRTNDKGSMIS